MRCSSSITPSCARIRPRYDRSNSSSLAIFAAMRRASSLVEQHPEASREPRVVPSAAASVAGKASPRPELKNRIRTFRIFLQRKLIIEAHFAERKSLLYGGSPDGYGPMLTTFRQALKDTGFVEKPLNKRRKSKANSARCLARRDLSLLRCPLPSVTLAGLLRTSEPNGVRIAEFSLI